MSFADRVTTLRVAANFSSSTKLAKAVGISQPSMSAIENGDTSVDELKVGTFMGLVKQLKTNPMYLYSGFGPIGPVISPDAEEAEAASLYRQLPEPYKAAWIQIAYVFRKLAPNGTPSTDAPYPALTIEGSATRLMAGTDDIAIALKNEIARRTADIERQNAALAEAKERYQRLMVIKAKRSSRPKRD